MSEGKRNWRQNQKVNRVQSMMDFVGHFKDNIKVTVFKYTFYFILKCKKE